MHGFFTSSGMKSMSIIIIIIPWSRIPIYIYIPTIPIRIPILFIHKYTLRSITNTQIGSIFNISSNTLHQIRSENSLLYKSHQFSTSTQVIIHHKLEILLHSIPNRLALISTNKSYSLSLVVRHIEFSTVLYQKLSTLPIFAHLTIRNTSPIEYMQRCITITILKKDIYSLTLTFPNLLPPRDTNSFNTSRFPYEAAACLKITANRKDSHWRVTILILHIRTHSTIQIALYLFKIPISSGNNNVIVGEVVLWLRNKIVGKYDDSQKIINIHDQFLAKIMSLSTLSPKANHNQGQILSISGSVRQVWWFGLSIYKTQNFSAFSFLESSFIVILLNGITCIGRYTNQ